MLKILHITDLHGHQSFYEWVKAQSQHYDVFYISGDLIGNTPSMKTQLSTDFDQMHFVIQWLEQITIPVFICSGNHDVINGSSDELNFPIP